MAHSWGVPVQCNPLATVLAGSLLQQRIESSSRATVISVAAVGEQLRIYLMYVLWALSGVLLSAALVLVVASLLGRLMASGARHPLGYGGGDDEEDA